MAIYGESLLERDERILYVAGTRWAAYVIAALLLLGLMMMRQLSGLFGARLTITNKRLLGRIGLLWVKSVAWPLKTIESVQMRQSLTGKLFGYGTLSIRSKDGVTLRFKGIAWPHEAQQVIEEAVEVAVLGHTLAQATLPKW